MNAAHERAYLETTTEEPPVLDLAGLQDATPQDVLDDYQQFDDTENYQDPQGPSLPGAGSYEFKILKAKLRADKNGKLILDTDKETGKTYKIVTLLSAQIVGGLGEGVTRNVGLLQDVRLQPFPRGQRADGTPIKASKFMDLLRSFDQTRASVRSQDEALELFNAFLSENLTFRGYADWTAEDWQGRQAELERIGHDPKNGRKVDNKVVNAIYDRFRVRSMFKFPKRPDGTYDQIWKSPAGTPIEARLNITRFYPSLETVVLGPSNN